MRRPLLALWLSNNAVPLGIALVFLALVPPFALVGLGGVASIEPRVAEGFVTATSLGNSGARRRKVPGLAHGAHFRLADGGVLKANHSAATELRHGDTVCLALFRGRWTGRRLAEVVDPARCGAAASPE